MIELNKVYLGDCMDGMAQMPDNFIDLAIVDPPYGIGDFNMKTSGPNKKKGRGNHRNYKTNCEEWNRLPPTAEYFAELYRVSVKRIIWGANYYNCFESGALVWYKNISHPNLSQCEIASLSFQKKVDYIHINWASGFYRQIAEDETIHPCQKPIKLYKWLLKNYAKPGDKILDTHVGSGSSIIACIDMGFDYIGYEIDPDYYAAMQDRIYHFTRQTALEGI